MLGGAIDCPKYFLKGITFTLQFNHSVLHLPLFPQKRNKIRKKVFFSHLVSQVSLYFLPLSLQSLLFHCLKASKITCYFEFFASIIFIFIPHSHATKMSTFYLQLMIRSSVRSGFGMIMITLRSLMQHGG